MLTTESVAYWFFRLNGCLTITDFIVHPDPEDDQPGQRTDADILAVRFPYRSEFYHTNPNNSMEDDALFVPNGTKTDLIIAEVKAGQCNLNGPWTRGERENIHRALYAVGAFPQPRVPDIAQMLYEDFRFEDEHLRVRLFAVGNEPNPRLAAAVVQVTWCDVLDFIFQRFRRYQWVKADHSHWDDAGKRLYHKVERHYDDPARFKAAVGEEIEVLLTPKVRVNRSAA